LSEKLDVLELLSRHFGMKLTLKSFLFRPLNISAQHSLSTRGSSNS